MKKPFSSYMSSNTRGWLCVLGGFILCLSFSADFSYPNINSYLTSYMRNNNTNGYNNHLTYDDFVFLTTTKVVLQGSSMPLVGDLCRRIGTRWSIFIGSAIYSGGFMMTFFTIKSHFALAIVSLALHGLGFSFVYATAISAAQKWFPRSKRGLVGSIVLSGYGYGSLIWVPIQTAFVNPDNVKAERDPACSLITLNGTEVEHDADCKNRYYTDPEMLARVPWMFLMLGCIYALCGMVATVLISEPEDISESQSFTSESGKSDVVEEIQNSLKPTEVLRTPVFYQIWAGFFSVGLCNGLMSTYSKTFGLTFINDDHFYATVAIVQNIFNGTCRVFWGFSYDKAGFKMCFLLIGFIVTVITALLPVLPTIGEETIGAKAGYGVLMTILYGTFPGIYAIVAAAVNDAFGPVHYKANFGLLFTQAIAYSAAIITMTKVPVFQAYLGYTGMFLVAGGFGVLGILAALFLPRHLSVPKKASKV